MSWTALADVLAAVFLVTGACFALVAAIGVLRLPDLLSRMHAATKPQVIGLMLVVIGLALRLREPSAVGILVLVVVMQMGTSVISSHMVARASFRAGQVRRDLLVLDDLSDHVGDGEESRGAP